MQLDTEGNELAAIFQEWQVPLVDEIFERNLTSSEAWGFLKDKGIRTTPNARNTISRASVIFFLNDLVDDGLLEYTEVSGKGGWGRKYEMTLTREEFAHRIIDRFFDKLVEAFPEESRTFTWIIP